MIDPSSFYKILIKNKITFFSGIPDSLLKNITAYISDNTKPNNHIIAANEGNSIALGIGYHLATNKIPLIYMQNSGLGNAVNPLLSLADKQVYSIPMLLMIGWRGEPKTKDEPQHIKQGRVTLNLLETMKIPYQIISSDTNNLKLEKYLKNAVQKCKKNNSTFALIIKKNTFSNYKIKKKEQNFFPLSREDAIKLIINKLNKNEIVISTTGVTSRELYEYRNELKQGHKKDFLTVGGMGHANQIALGIALQKKNRKIYCLDGDGSLIMHMGSMGINANVNCNNYVHIVLNNGVHDSVGGQKTIGLKINLSQIAKAVGYDYVYSADSKKKINKYLKILSKKKGMCFLEIKIKKGFRKNLSRPKEKPKENKIEFMKYMK